VNEDFQENICTSIPTRGLSAEKVQRMVDERLAADLTFPSGHILGSMCSQPHLFSEDIFQQQLSKNIGDPGLHPALAEMEAETIRILGDLFRNPQAVGSIVTGGTEANLLAMWTAKNSTSPVRREVVLPMTAHFSFDKAASLMDLQLIKIPVDTKNRVKIEEYRRAIGPHTMALVGIAGTTGLGAVDPLEEISELALQHELYLHVDAAFGGFVLPFLKSAGYPHDQSPFDFRLPGVSSLTVDPHKMGRTPIPSGCILYRSEKTAGSSTTHVAYLAGGKTRQRTIVGTRSGAAVAAVWATLQHLGLEGFTRTVRECMEQTHFLKNQIESRPGIETVIEPVMNVLGVRPTYCDPDELAGRLRQRGYALSQFPGFLRLTLMPHLSREHLERFLEVLQEELSRRNDG
jgi:tyrosine decarboxylase / aspartate 1-decarboxylase